MRWDEIKFFFKHIGKTYLHEIKSFAKGITNLARPKLWYLILSGILIYEIWNKAPKFELMFILSLIVFVWIWDIYEAGHWRADMRKELYDKIKKNNKVKKKENN